MSAVFLLELAVATGLAWLVRFEGDVPSGGWDLAWSAFPLIAAVYLIAYVLFGAHRGLWSFTGLHDFVKIPKVALAGAIGSYVLTRDVLGWINYPRSIYILTAVFLFVLMALDRGGVRLLQQQAHRWGKSGIPVVIVGAGQAGEMLVRDMLHAEAGAYRPAAFIDDDASKHGSTIHGVPVVGGHAALAAAIARYQPQEVIIAIPSASPAQLRRIVGACQPCGLPIKVLPSVHDILRGRVALSSVRPLALADLLTREPVPSDTAGLASLIRGKRVLVTGAGGSIGSELCRQIAQHAPAQLVLVERYENNLHAVAAAIDDLYGAEFVDTRAFLADVLDELRMQRIFEEHRPQLVFHAAAHKHVPIVEENPCEGVLNNVLGTHRVAMLCRRWSVERMILISTDKAVNPTNVMGATKRFAESIVTALSGTGPTRYITVRFGNVLGSNGSVVPRFQQQIARGGPVTVTHPEIERFFMLIPEAVHLVLEAARRGRGGEVFVLDMGDPIKIVDLAHNMIRLAGFVPNDDIPVVFSGLRPGEKLFEELFEKDERVEPTEHPKLRKAVSDAAWSETELRAAVTAVTTAARVGDGDGLREALRQFVRSYQPEALPATTHANGSGVNGVPVDVEVSVATVRSEARNRASS
ncbi:MAG TPA: nucleoside-diphosphate sugar epimerase/dehydratase [Nitrospiria bacterium]|nr:nucleoside-diphosphate sugar epimerase/dehydratase [Nitrospiria bacterium]